MNDAARVKTCIALPTTSKLPLLPTLLTPPDPPRLLGFVLPRDSLSWWLAWPYKAGWEAVDDPFLGPPGSWLVMARNLAGPSPSPPVAFLLDVEETAGGVLEISFLGSSDHVTDPLPLPRAREVIFFILITSIHIATKYPISPIISG